MYFAEAGFIYSLLSFRRSQVQLNVVEIKVEDAKTPPSARKPRLFLPQASSLAFSRPQPYLLPFPDLPPPATCIPSCRPPISTPPVPTPAPPALTVTYSIPLPGEELEAPARLWETQTKGEGRAVLYPRTVFYQDPRPRRASGGEWQRTRIVIL